MEQLTNPLRGKPLRSLPAQDEQIAIPKAATSVEAPKEMPKPVTKLEPVVAAAPKMESRQAAMIPHSIEVNTNPELKRAMELLARHGIETSAPKKNYIKHSYEIEEELHKEFHEMYPLLGFKHVKTAINDAIRMWCEENRKEFNRRKGS